MFLENYRVVTLVEKEGLARRWLALLPADMLLRMFKRLSNGMQ